MAQYTNVGGVARKVTKRYENVGGVARNVIKAYNNVNGVARLYFSGGVKWRKWSCDYTEASDTWYEEVDSNGIDSRGDTYTVNWGGETWPLYEGYGFTEAEGYWGDGYEERPIADAVGFYEVSSERVESVTDVTVGEYGYEVTLEIVGLAEGYYYPASYDKGSTDYGIVQAPKGELPEDGYCAEGSATGDYCVVEVDGTYYYYEKIEEE